jgi:uncharacterized membrane protein YsdA (DUF1294 family)
MQSAAGRQVAVRIWAAAGLAVLLVVTLIAQRAPAWLAAVYLVVGAVALLLCYLDKRAARLGGWRIREANLHAVDLLGGILGGLLGQHWFRHKTSKAAYAVTTWSIVALHAAGLLALLAGIIEPATVGLSEW